MIKDYFHMRGRGARNQLAMLADVLKQRRTSKRPLTKIAKIDRVQHLLKRIDRSMSIIEIGPSHRPLAPKRDGWHTTVVDHAPSEEIAAKYAAHKVDLSQIENVDVVWNGGDLSCLFASSDLGSYDAILASHVIEHMPDPISFFKSASALLKPSGIIVLAVPDKRFSFDFFGSITTTADWLTAHEYGARTHSRRSAFNHVAYAVSNAGKIGWGQIPPTDLALVHTLEEAWLHFTTATDSGVGGYVDYHAWRFTPSSMKLILLESFILCGLDLDVIECTPALNHEFFVTIGLLRAPMDRAHLADLRMELLRAIILEIGQQSDVLSRALADNLVDSDRPAHLKV